MSRVDETPAAKYLAAQFANYPAVVDALMEFLESRRELCEEIGKAPPRETLLIGKAIETRLHTLAGDLAGFDSDKAVSIISQAVMNGWRNLYPLSGEDR